MSVQWGGVPCPAKCSTWRKGLLAVAIAVVAMADERAKWEGKAGRAFERAQEGCPTCKDGLDHITILRKYRQGDPILTKFGPGREDEARAWALEYHESFTGLTITFVPVSGEMGIGFFNIEEKTKK